MRKRLLRLMLILVLVLAGCGAQVNSVPNVSQITQCAVAEASPLFSGPFSQVPLGAEGETFLSVCIGADSIGICSFKPVDPSDSSNEFQFVETYITIFDRTGKLKTAFPIAMDTVTDMDFYDENTLCLLGLNGREDDSVSNTYALTLLDISSETVSSEVPLMISQEEVPADILCWDQDTVLVSFEDGSIASYNTAGRQTAVAQSGLWSPMFVRGDGGKVYLVGIDGACLTACTFSPEDGLCGEKVPLAESAWYQLAPGCGGYDFFISLSNQIYGVNLEHWLLTSVFDGYACGVDLNHVAFFAVGEQLLLCDNLTEDFLVDEYVLYSCESAAEQVETRRTLRLGTLSISSDLQDAVAEFNRTNPAYVIAVEDYSQYGEGGKKRMQVDFMSGNIPDIINLAGLQATSLNSPDYLLDLTSYLEESGVQEDLQPTVLEALRKDGQLLSITPNFTIELLCSFTDTAEQTLTLAQCCAQLTEQQEKRSLTSQAVLDILLKNSLNDLIQGETQQIDTAQLKRILETAAAYPAEAVEDGSTEKEQLISGNLLFSATELSSLRSFRALLFDLGEEVRLYGYPGETGDAVLLNANNYLAISKSAQDPEGAWAFIETMLAPVFQTKYMHRTFPVRISCLQAAIQEAAQTEMGFSDKAQALLDCTLARIGPQPNFGDVVLDIIYEEAERCFAGSVPIEQAVSAIESRLQVYLAEQS